jgi:hypothetical protein
MPSIQDFFPDKWLHAGHLQGKRPRVAIAAVNVETLFNPRTKKNEQKLVVAFHGKELRLILNKTQARSLATICKTDDYSMWKGYEVVLSTGKAPNGADTILISPIPDAPPPKPAAQVEEPAAPEGGAVHGADASIFSASDRPAKSPDDASPAQLLRLTKLMAQAYGTAWGQHEAECAQQASKGAVRQFSDLKAVEAQVLIGKLEAGVPQSANGKVAAHA